jgi:hypothetical protein
MNTNEPVVWMVNGKSYTDIFEAEHYSKFTNKPMTPFYTHPADLTDEEIIGCAQDVKYSELSIAVNDFYILFARAILKKASEK